MNERPVLIIDCLNLFTRSYAAFPQMSSHGYQMGGAIGFLKTLRRLVLEIQPKTVCIAWEGGGSQRRRKLYPNYKLSRKPEKLNRFYGDDIPDSEENRQHQLVTLLGLLKTTPTCQIYVPDCEGDDIIAYLCNNTFVNDKKVIASSDKDMYQLLNDDTNVYSFHKKKILTKDDVLDEFRVTSKNFAIAKSLCGDASDNIPGVKGLGFKTVSKLYPFLGLENDILLQDVFDYAASHVDESRIHQRVIESKNDVIRNWNLVYLGSSVLSGHQSSSVDHLVSKFSPRCDRMSMIRLLAKEGIGDFDVESFFYAFNCIDNVDHQKN